MNTDGNEFLELRFEDVGPDPDQPRKFFDIVKIDELAASMRAQGQILPIAVRDNPAYWPGSKEPKYLIVDGERRWTAGARAKMPFIEAVVKVFKDLSAVQIIANDEREALNPVERAEAIQRRIHELEEQGVESPKSVVAKERGRSPAWVSKALKLMSLDEEIRALARTGKVKDIDTLQKLSKCKQKKRLEAFEMIERNEFNAKEFFRRKRKTPDHSEASKLEPRSIPNKSKKPSRSRNYSFSLPKLAVSELMTRTGFSEEQPLEGIQLEGATDEEFEVIINDFRAWLENISIANSRIVKASQPA